MGFYFTVSKLIITKRVLDTAMVVTEVTHKHGRGFYVASAKGTRTMLKMTNYDIVYLDKYFLITHRKLR